MLDAYSAVLALRASHTSQSAHITYRPGSAPRFAGVRRQVHVPPRQRRLTDLATAVARGVLDRFRKQPFVMINGCRPAVFGVAEHLAVAFAVLAWSAS